MGALLALLSFLSYFCRRYFQAELYGCTWLHHTRIATEMNLKHCDNQDDS